MKTITCKDLENELNNGKDWHVIDVREDHERAVSYFTDNHIPMGDVMSRIDEIPTDKPVAIHCKSGKRSAAVIHTLESHYDFDNLHNLDGGILAWVKEVDPSLPLE